MRMRSGRVARLCRLCSRACRHVVYCGNTKTSLYRKFNISETVQQFCKKALAIIKKTICYVQNEIGGALRKLASVARAFVLMRYFQVNASL